MNGRQQSKIATGVGIVVVAGIVCAIAVANPNCDRGCQNNLEHLFTHVLDDVIKGLLA